MARNDNTVNIVSGIIFVTGPPARACLPTSVTIATFLASFKRQLKTFLFTKSFP